MLAVAFVGGDSSLQFVAPLPASAGGVPVWMQLLVKDEKMVLRWRELGAPDETRGPLRSGNVELPPSDRTRGGL